MSKLFVDSNALHEAINIRANNYILFFDDEKGDPVFTSKHQIYKDTNQMVSEWGYELDSLDLRINVIRGRELNRKQFKKEYSSYRRYMAQCDPAKEKLIELHSKSK